MNTNGEVISRIKTTLKAVKQDAFLTDRFVYSLIMKYASLLMRRQDNLFKIMRYNSIFQSLVFVELEDVDKVNADCVGIMAGCEIKRTKNKLPDMIEGYFGPIIRIVTSLDYSVEFKYTFPSIYEKMSKQKSFKYNKNHYYWYMDGRLYFPNTEFDAVKVDGVFIGDISDYTCDQTEICTFMQDIKIPVPDFLFAEIEQFIMRDFGITLQIPSDVQHDNKNIIK